VGTRGLQGDGRRPRENLGAMADSKERQKRALENF